MRDVRPLLCCSFFLLAGASYGGAEQVEQVGPGVTPPKLLNRTEPTYTRQALDAQVQGAALFEIVIGVDGMPSDITLISPLGFGLDERAHDNIEKWRFKPAEKNGSPVAVTANVQVNFRLLNTQFDSRKEQQRTTYKAALQHLSRPEKVGRALEEIQKLSDQKFPPAAYLHATLLREGRLLPKDQERSLALFKFASEKDYGPALYEIGRMHVDGKDLPLEVDKGIRLIKEASVLGSARAQFYLGNLYERGGQGIERDVDAAKRQFRLCAATGEALCQLRLARILLVNTSRTEREAIQAVAWLQLASEGGSEEAKRLLEQESLKLTQEQLSQTSKLKAQLVRK